MSIDLERVVGLSKDLQRATSVRAVLEAARRAVAGATRYRTVWISVFEELPEGRWVRILGTSGTAEEIIWEESPRFPAGDDPFLREIGEAKAPVVSVDMRTDPRTNKETVERLKLRTGINVPLLLGGDVIGALGVATFGDEGVLPPTDEELEHLSVFAGLVAAAFDRVRLLVEKGRADHEVRSVRERQRQLETQLLEAQKMEVVATLASGIAHDFNNLLMAILCHAELVKLQVGGPEAQRSSLDTILSAARRASHLTRNLLIFSRKHSVTSQPVSLPNLLESLVQLLRPALREDIHLIVESADDDLVVTADPGALEQVLLNLAYNARDAMEHGGTLTLRATREPGRALIAVSDTGTGMSPDVLSQIFEPFFTTKAPGKGTGLGLPTSRGIVDQLGGRMTVESTPGVGTTFRILLPLAGAREASAGEVRGELAAGRGTILVAEDDDAVRALIATVLESRGYRVLQASDGQEAIVTFRSHSHEIDLVLTDVIMPGRSGREVREAVAAFRQHTRVLFMTGYGADALGDDLEGPILAKPISPSDLLAAVAEALRDPLTSAETRGARATG